jgi:hypothetical protein
MHALSFTERVDRINRPAQREETGYYTPCPTCKTDLHPEDAAKITKCNDTTCKTMLCPDCGAACKMCGKLCCLDCMRVPVGGDLLQCKMCELLAESEARELAAKERIAAEMEMAERFCRWVV